MSAQYLRGGMPSPLVGTATTTVGQHQIGRPDRGMGISNFLHFENRGANDIVLAFSVADMTAGRTITIPTGLGVIGNPLSLPVEAANIWVKTLVGAAAFTLLALLRRG